MTAAIPAQTAKEFLRLAHVAGQLDYISKHGKSFPGEKLLAKINLLGLETRVQGIKSLLGGNNSRSQMQPFDLSVMRLGQGGEAYLQTLEKHAAATIDEIKARAPQSMGVFSLNPAKWGLTSEEADAYDIAQAKKAAALKEINPGILDTLGSTVQGATKSAGQASTALMWTGAAILAAWGISELVSARGQSIAEGFIKTKQAANKRY